MANNPNRPVPPWKDIAKDLGWDQVLDTSDSSDSSDEDQEPAVAAHAAVARGPVAFSAIRDRSNPSPYVHRPPLAQGGPVGAMPAGPAFPQASNRYSPPVGK